MKKMLAAIRATHAIHITLPLGFKDRHWMIDMAVFLYSCHIDKIRRKVGCYCVFICFGGPELSSDFGVKEAPCWIFESLWFWALGVSCAFFLHGQRCRCHQLRANNTSLLHIQYLSCARMYGVWGKVLVRVKDGGRDIILNTLVCRAPCFHKE